LAKKTKTFEKVTARQEGARAKIVSLGQEIQDLGEQLAELASKVAEATSMRNKEHADNTAVIKDSTESIEAISAAIATLNEYYGGEALLQTGQPKSDTASVITRMLQTAQSDFEKLKGDTEFSESKGLSNYEDFMQESKVSAAKKGALKDGKTAERSSVKAALSEISEDLANATKAMDGASNYLKSVNERCAHKEMSFAERVAAREAEVNGLREALTILGGDSAAFLQKRN